MGRPKITVITAVYNGAATIEQTIQSVVGQDYDNFEYIVIDGKSTDGTTDILKKYGDKISYWLSEPDQGIYDAFNKGVRHATGDYVQFLGADDCLCDKKVLSNIAEHISDDLDVLSAGIWLVDEKYKVQRYLGNQGARDKKRFSGGMIPHTGMFVRTELLKGNPFDISYKINADYLFFLTCYYDDNIKFKFIDLPVAFFSMSGVSSTDDVKRMEENRKIWGQFGISPLPLKDNILKELLKKGLKNIGVFETVQYAINRYLRHTLVSHHCEWLLCRWCKRV